MVKKGLLLGVGVLGATGVGVYSIIPSFSNTNKLGSKHRGIFNEVHKAYSSKKYSRANDKKAMKIEIMSPDDPWWHQKWKEYKDRSTDFPSFGTEVKEDLESFQGICYSEIKRKGLMLADAAKYSTDEGKLDQQTKGVDYMSYQDVEDKKFVWELCLKITVFTD